MSLKKLLLKLPLESRKVASENISLLMSESGDSLAFCVFARTIIDMFDGSLRNFDYSYYVQEQLRCLYFCLCTSNQSVTLSFSLQGFTTAQVQQLEDNTEIVKQREKEIQHIVQSIGDLNSIFKDLSIMVIDQVCNLSLILDNLKHANVSRKRTFKDSEREGQIKIQILSQVEFKGEAIETPSICLCEILPKIKIDSDVASFKRQWSSLLESFPRYILLDNKSSTVFLMVLFMGKLVNNGSRSRRAIKRLRSKFITFSAKKNESLTMQS